MIPCVLRIFDEKDPESVFRMKLVKRRRGED